MSFNISIKKYFFHFFYSSYFARFSSIFLKFNNSGVSLGFWGKVLSKSSEKFINSWSCLWRVSYSTLEASSLNSSIFLSQNSLNSLNSPIWAFSISSLYKNWLKLTKKSLIKFYFINMSLFHFFFISFFKIELQFSDFSFCHFGVDIFASFLTSFLMII